MRNIWHLIATALVIASCGGHQPKHKSSLLIAVASNVQFVMDELITEFESIYQIDCDLVVSSSGKITSQILAGATYDVFISADQLYPLTIYEQGLTVGKPIYYATGALIFWSQNHKLEAGDFSLTDEKFGSIAIANPRLAPYGKAAEKAMKNMGIYDVVKDRLVFGENISQVNQFVTLGAADIGITSQSVVLSSAGRGVGSWVALPDSLYEPLLQDLVVLKNGNAQATHLKAFINFVQGQKGLEIMQRYGYR